MSNNLKYTLIIKQVVDPSTPGEPGILITAPLSETLAYDSTSEYNTPFTQGLFANSAGATQLAAVAGIRLAAQAQTAQVWAGSSESDITLEIEFQTVTDPDIDVRTPILNLLKLSTASIDTATGMLKSPGPRIDIADTLDIAVSGVKQVGGSLGEVGGALKQVAVVGIANAALAGGLIQQSNLNSNIANLNGKNARTIKPEFVGGIGGAQYWKSVIRNQISVQVGNYAFFDSVVILNVSPVWSHQMDSRTGLPLHAKVSVRFKPMFLVTQQDLDQIFARPPSI